MEELRLKEEVFHFCIPPYLHRLEAKLAPWPEIVGFLANIIKPVPLNVYQIQRRDMTRDCHTSNTRQISYQLRVEQSLPGVKPLPKRSASRRHQFSARQAITSNEQSRLNGIDEYGYQLARKR